MQFIRSVSFPPIPSSLPAFFPEKPGVVHFIEEESVVQIELHFHIHGSTLPTLHGYSMYSALCHIQPSFHQADWLGIHTIRGQREGEGVLRLAPNSRLRLRLPQDRIGDALLLSGQAIKVGRHTIQIGVPEVRPLLPAPSLSARMVTIKGYTEPEPFAGACRRQLDALEVAGEVELGRRLVQRAGRATIIGFATRIHNLTPEESLRVQESGLGGRRRMGCGLLVPCQVAVAK
jgi:CRISPR-associated protein Cas6